MAETHPPAQKKISLTCGVLITDGAGLLLGHATRSARWDIPKGLADDGEELADAAIRETREETGLIIDPAALVALGIHLYLPRKDLALFLWHQAAMPDLTKLICSSSFTARGRTWPEIDRFGIFEWNDAVGRGGPQHGPGAGRGNALITRPDRPLRLFRRAADLPLLAWGLGYGRTAARESRLTNITYRVVPHDGGWAYTVDGVFSEPFPSHDAARRAATEAAREQQAPGETAAISWEDKDGVWHEEIAQGNDRPHTDVKG